MNDALWLRIGAVWGFLAVAIGAFGAHGLRPRIEAMGQLANFQTAAQYHMYMALAILVVGLLQATGRSGTALSFAGWAFLIGSLIFSGSLYALSVTGMRWLGAITPIGGTAILIGWIALAVSGGGTAKPAAVAPSAAVSSEPVAHKAALTSSSSEER